MKSLLLSLALAVAALALAHGPGSLDRAAHAEIDGPCQGTVAGQDVGSLDSSKTGDAIEVEKDDVVDVVLTSTSGVAFQSHKIDLEIAGISFNIEDDPEDNDPTVTETVNIDDYAIFGVGLYKVSGSAQLQDGTSCSGAVLIQIKGNPLTTIGGIAALVVGAIGVAFVGLAVVHTLQQFRQLRKKVEAWAAEQVQRINAGQAVSQEELVASLRSVAKPPGMFQLWMIALLPAMLLMGASMPGGLASSAGSVIVRLPRLGFRPKFSLLGAIGGSLVAESISAFLNFLAVSPLTGSSVILGAVLGILVGVMVDSGMRWFGSRDVNAAIAKAERELSELLERRRRQTGGEPPPATATP